MPTSGPASVNLLGNLDTLEVSLVSQGANGRRLALAKSAPASVAGASPMPTAQKPAPSVAKGYIDPFAAVSPLEERMLAAAGGDKLTEKGREAVLMAARCLASAGEELAPEDALATVRGMLGIAAPAGEKVAPATAAAPATDTAKGVAKTAAEGETAAPPAESPAGDASTDATDEAPAMKACAACKAESPMDATACKDCGAEFPAAEKADATAAKGAPTAGDVHVPATEDQAKTEKTATPAAGDAPISKAAIDAMPAEVRKAFDAVQKRAEEAEKVLKARAREDVRKGFIAKAAGWKSIVGKTAEQIGDLLLALEDKAPELRQQVEALIGQTSAAVEKSGLLTEAGRSAAASEATGDDPIAQVEALAKRHIDDEAKAGRTVSLEKATAHVWKQRPDLYAMYDAAHMARSARAEGA